MTMALAVPQHDSAMHRVLVIHELLDMIFSFSDISDITNYARVCKRWSDVALDILWREINDFDGLFSLLAPLDHDGKGIHEFSRLPESNGWKRFECYSRRVQHLRYRANVGARHKRKPPLAQFTFVDVVQIYTSLSMLPNIHTLDWKGPVSLCILFMHSNVRRFTAYLDVQWHKYLTTSSTTIVDRMPNLTYLNLVLTFPMSRIASNVAGLLQGLTKLEQFVVSQYCVTTEIMNALSKLEFLGTVEFQYSEDDERGCPDDVMEFKPILEEGAFPSLWHLRLAVGYGDFARFVNAPFAPTNLRFLHLDSHFFETPEDIKTLLGILSNNCQLLHSLALYSRIDVPNLTLDLDPADDQCLTFECLKPLLEFPNLVSFEVVHNNPVYLNQNDIEELAKKWPSVETLFLNDEPGFINHARLGLEALLPFARHCPRLRDLGLYLNASILDQSCKSMPTSSELIRPLPYVPRLKCLERLSVGVSPISESDINGVTLFLSSICAMDCAVETDITWDNFETLDRQVRGTIAARSACWERVNDMLPGMIELRLQERERARQLEVEIEDLKRKNSVLLDELCSMLSQRRAEDSGIEAELYSSIHK